MSRSWVTWSSGDFIAIVAPLTDNWRKWRRWPRRAAALPRCQSHRVLLRSAGTSCWRTVPCVCEWSVCLCSNATRADAETYDSQRGCHSFLEAPMVLHKHYWVLTSCWLQLVASSHFLQSLSQSICKSECIGSVHCCSMMSSSGLIVEVEADCSVLCLKLVSDCIHRHWYKTDKNHRGRSSWSVPGGIKWKMISVDVQINDLCFLFRLKCVWVEQQHGSVWGQ